VATVEGITISRALRAGVWSVTLAGKMAESFDPRALTGSVSGFAILDLDGVHSVTSFGVRQWVAAMQELRAEYVGLVRCRPSFAWQFNAVKGFAGRGELLSFYTAYACPHCQHSFESLLDVRDHFATLTACTAPEVTCPLCHRPAQLDDLPRVAFAYVASQPRPRPPPRVEAVLDAVAGKRGHLLVDKEVAGQLTVLALAGAMDSSGSLRRVGHGLEGDVLVMADAVTSVTAEGVEAFSALATESRVRMFVARAPLDLARGLEDGHVISVTVPYGCRACATCLDLEVTVGAVHFAKQACPVCGQELAPMCDPGALDAVASMHPPTLPAPVFQQLVDSSERQTDTDGFARETPRSFDGAGGTYRLVRRLGLGGMAEVYLAQLTGPGDFVKPVALKWILPRYARQDEFIRMFMDEAKVAARLSHPNIVQTFAVGSVQGRHYIAMEYVRGWDLNHVLRTTRRLAMQMPNDLACRVAADLCAGLAAAHGYTDEEGFLRPIVHRDVSPHNVLVSSDGIVKLSDFGVAKASDSSATPTDPGGLKGKLDYLAPEYLAGRAQPGPLLDIYATGVVLVQCLTGELPVRGGLPEPCELPAPIRVVVQRALASDPRDRYPEANAFRRELEDAVLKLYGRMPGSEDLAIWLRQLLTLANEREQTNPKQITYKEGLPRR
jgi:hypothetical protein